MYSQESEEHKAISLSLRSGPPGPGKFAPLYCRSVCLSVCLSACLPACLLKYTKLNSLLIENSPKRNRNKSMESLTDVLILTWYTFKNPTGCGHACTANQMAEKNTCVDLLLGLLLTTDFAFFSVSVSFCVFSKTSIFSLVD